MLNIYPLAKYPVSSTIWLFWISGIRQLNFFQVFGIKVAGKFAIRCIVKILKSNKSVAQNKKNSHLKR